MNWLWFIFGILTGAVLVLIGKILETERELLAERKRLGMDK